MRLALQEYPVNSTNYKHWKKKARDIYTEVQQYIHSSSKGGWHCRLDVTANTTRVQFPIFHHRAQSQVSVNAFPYPQETGNPTFTLNF